jgi:hypothetical protein
MFAPQRDPDARRATIQFADPVLAGDGSSRDSSSPQHPRSSHGPYAVEVEGPEAHEVTAATGAVVLAALGGPVFGWGSHGLCRPAMEP